MNWYKTALMNTEIANQLSLLDTRGKADSAKANEIILKAMDIKVGDKLIHNAGMSSGKDKNYEVRSINPNFSINVLALETGRFMFNVNLFNFLKHNQPIWEKVV